MTSDVIETLEKWLQNAAAAGWAGRDSAYYKSNEMATSLHAQIAPTLRAEGMERAADLIDAECARVLATQNGKNPAVDANIRLMAVLLPDLSEAFRAQAKRLREGGEG